MSERERERETSSIRDKVRDSQTEAEVSINIHISRLVGANKSNADGVSGSTNNVEGRTKNCQRTEPNYKCTRWETTEELRRRN